MTTQSGDKAVKYTQGDYHDKRVKAVIENPLGHLNQEQVIKEVREFAEVYQLTDIVEGLERGAIIAQNQDYYRHAARNGNRPGNRVQLNEREKKALRNETDTLLAQSPGLYMTIVTISLAAFLQGHVQSSLNGATLYFPELFNIPISENALESRVHNEWLVGVVNAAPFFFAAVLGCPLVDPINYRLGRRGAILVAAFLIFVSSLGSAFTRTWQELFITRIFNGIGMGLKASSVPILASETAVSAWRGSSVLNWQLHVAGGIMVGFAANLLFQLASTDRTKMQLILGAPFFPALMLMISIYWCPESPRWHMLQGDTVSYRKAYNVFCNLRNTELQAQRDLFYIHKQIEAEAAHQAELELERRNGQAPSISLQRGLVVYFKNYVKRFLQLFTQLRLRNALLGSCTVMLAQQLSGINVLAFYSGTLFSTSGSESNKAFLYSFGFGLVNFIFGLPAIRTIDTHGRRRLLLVTLPFMSLSLLISGLLFLPLSSTNTPPSGRIPIIAIFLYIFAALYSPGMGPMPFTISSESFPLSHRETGVAVCVSVNLFLAGVLTVFYPRLSTALTNPGAIGLFSGCNVLAFVLILLWVPETKQRSLEELDAVFKVPVGVFMRYKVCYYVPWCFKRYVLGWKDIPLRKLYDDKVEGRIAEQEKETIRVKSAGGDQGVKDGSGVGTQPIGPMTSNDRNHTSNDHIEAGGVVVRARDSDQSSINSAGTFD